MKRENLSIMTAQVSEQSGEKKNILAYTYKYTDRFMLKMPKECRTAFFYSFVTNCDAVLDSILPQTL